MSDLRLNLWELITGEHARRVHEHDPRIQQTHDIVQHLSDSARMKGQELAIEPVEEGWLIEVFSCWDDQRGTPQSGSWFILIPKHGGTPLVSKCWPPDIVDAVAQIGE
jgi:hypothetical protein